MPPSTLGFQFCSVGIDRAELFRGTLGNCGMLGTIWTVVVMILAMRTARNSLLDWRGLDNSLIVGRAAA